MAKRIKYQQVAVVVPAATATATVINVKDYLDSQYARATALGVVRVSGTDSVALGLRSQNDQIIDPVNSKFLEVTESTPVQGRFIPLNVPAGGKEVTLTAQPLVAATAGQNVFHVLFKLED